MGRSRVVLFMCLSIISVTAVAQTNRYMVFFKDKAGNPFAVSQPLQFLSPKAVERRAAQGIAVTEQDLPVNPNYVSAVKNSGADTYFTTRWMNGLLIQAEPVKAAEIASLPFVERVELVAPNARLSPGGRKKGQSKIRTTAAEITDAQLGMLGIPEMHADGNRGEGIIIAVFDAGFQGVNTTAPFAHLFVENRINLAVSKDFVYNSDDVFQYDQHGTNVFSVIAAYVPGTFTGGAYEATFQLFVTEEVPTEYRVEEYNWLFAAERADSAGAQIIHSSLGYYDFDLSSMDYQKSQMNGEVAVVSRAAQWASDRGIVIVASAGNEGNNSWRIITAPADAAGVLAVANVNQDGDRSNSSSIGPSADNRIKPDVAALGTNTNVITATGSTGKASGTSLSAPLVTSLVAGVWQRYPDLSSEEILTLIRNSGSIAADPDNFIGYGIPSYNNIVSLMEQDVPFLIYKNPFQDSIRVQARNDENLREAELELYSSDGRILHHTIANFTNTRLFELPASGFPDGLYILKIRWNDRTFTYKLVKK